MTRSRKQRQPKNNKTQSNVTANAQTASLARTSLHEEVEALKRDQQWYLKQIKRKRSELQNFVAQLTDISKEIFRRSRPVIEQITERDREIHQLFQEILTKRKASKNNLKKIQSIYSSLQMEGVISPEQDQQKENVSEPDNEQKQQQTTETRQPSADKSPNQPKLRETFLRLASRFHPDKVADEETQTQYTAIMQEVNDAYQQGDFARLLEIERKQHDQDLHVASQDNESSLEKQHAKLIRDNELLKQQYEEIKQELRYLRRTPEGEAVTEYRRATKEGIDPIAEMVEQAENQLEHLTEIRDFVKDFLDKKITIKQFLTGPSVGREMSYDELDAIEELLGRR